MSAIWMVYDHLNCCQTFELVLRVPFSISRAKYFETTIFSHTSNIFVYLLYVKSVEKIITSGECLEAV